MNRNILFTLIFCTGLVGCATEKKYVKPIPRPINEVEEKFISQEFKLLYRKNELPGDVVRLVSPIAEPGERFNNTDMFESGPDVLPPRRIIFGGTSDKMVFLFLDQGGFAPHRKLLLFENVNGILEPRSEYFLPIYADNLPYVKSLIKDRAYEYYDEKKRILTSQRIPLP